MDFRSCRTWHLRIRCSREKSNHCAPYTPFNLYYGELTNAGIFPADVRMALTMHASIFFLVDFCRCPNFLMFPQYVPCMDLVCFIKKTLNGKGKPVIRNHLFWGNRNKGWGFTFRSEGTRKDKFYVRSNGTERKRLIKKWRWTSGSSPVLWFLTWANLACAT